MVDGPAGVAVVAHGALDGGECVADSRGLGAGAGEGLDEGGECFRAGRKRGGVVLAGEGFPFAPTVAEPGRQALRRRVSRGGVHRGVKPRSAGSASRVVCH